MRMGVEKRKATSAGEKEFRQCGMSMSHAAQRAIGAAVVKNLERRTGLFDGQWDDIWNRCSVRASHFDFIMVVRKLFMDGQKKRGEVFGIIE